MHILFVLWGQLLPHFVIEYRAFFTAYHPTAEKMMGGIEVGATETCLIMYSLQCAFAFFGNECAHDDVFNFGKPFGSPIELSMTWGGFFIAATGILTIQYTITMFKAGYDAAKDKKLALMCLIPYFQLNLMAVCAFQFSHLWKDHAAWFLVYLGILITNITGNFNLKSCASKVYNPIYIDPFLFAGVLYLDANQILDLNIIKGMYVYLCVQRLALYLLFLRSVIN